MQISKSIDGEVSKCCIYSTVNYHWWMSMLFHQQGLAVVMVGLSYIWWQWLDNDNCQIGVALPMKFTFQDSGCVFLKGEVV